MDHSTKIYVLSAENLFLLVPDSRWFGSSGNPSISHGKCVVKPPEKNEMGKAEYPSTVTLPTVEL